MKKYINAVRHSLNFSFLLFILFSSSPFSAFSQEMPKMPMDTSISTKRETGNLMQHLMLPMPFLTHMGMPLSIGTHGLRASILPARENGKTNTEFKVQYMTGITKTVGILLEAEGTFHSNPAFEIMFQFVILKSKDGMSGISSIIEFEIPTEKGVRRVNTIIGFSTAIVKSHFAFNQAFHYDPREDLVDGSAAVVYELTKKVFLVVELSGKTVQESNAVFNLLGGIKVRVSKNFLLGIGYRHPITNNNDFSSQYILQSDMMWKK
jgi:hypothetical protein